MLTIASTADILPLFLPVVSIACFCFLIFGREGKLNYPPGPWGLPIIGNLPQLGSTPHIALTELGNVYGDVFSVRLGSREAVVLNSEEAVRQALLQNSRQFSDRPPMSASAIRGVRKFSIVFGEYSPAQALKKRCALKAIHQVVFNNLEHFNKIVHDAFLNFKADLVGEEVQTFKPSIQLKLAVVKIIFNFTFGEGPRNQQLSEEVQKLVVESDKFTESSAATALVDFLPWLKPFMRKQIATVEQSVEALINFVDKVYTSRKQQATNDSCIAFCVTKLWEKAKKKPNEHKYDINMNLVLEEQNDISFSLPKGKPVNNGDEEIVKMISADVFGAGLETVSNALSWAMAYIVNSPKIQQSLHQELDIAVGRLRLPTIQDKPNMPLLQATVLEVLRITSLVPLALPHQTSEEAKLCGYTIPKATLVIVNLWAVNHDPRVFENPHVFNPYRFLNEDGEVCQKKTKFQLPFSIGSRRCLGSTLAKAEIFLLLACLLQHFEFSSTTGENVDLESHFGLTLRPKPFSVCARLRCKRGT